MLARPHGPDLSGIYGRVSSIPFQSAITRTYRCVHVLLASGVSKPIRKLRRPACAIMMPLSIQNLDARVIEMNTEAGHIDRARYVPLIHGEDMSSTLPCHDAHHLLKPFIACIQ